MGEGSMKIKSIFLCILILGIVLISDFCNAEPAVVKDISVDIEGSLVKISITSNQALQVETFRNDESPANYIVLDFLGTVYSKLPNIVQVDRGAVEKVSLVRGDENEIQILDENYYALDFLAINLNSAADYRVSQSKAVIDLSIETVTGVESRVAESAVEPVSVTTDEKKTVELTPPIVVSKRLARQQRREKTTAVEKDTYPKETEKSQEYKQTRKSRKERTAKKEKKKEKKKREKRRRKKSGLFNIILAEKDKVVEEIPERESVEKSRRKRSRREKATVASVEKSTTEEKPLSTRRRSRKERSLATREKAPEEDSVTRKQRSRRKKPIATRQRPHRDKPIIAGEPISRRVDTSSKQHLIDRIVDETIREREDSSARIDDLTYTLKKMQEELYLSRGQRVKLEGKIKEILAKLDELQGALDAAIERRKELGQTVDDLIAKRELYIRTKREYEELEKNLMLITDDVEVLNEKVKDLEYKLDVIQAEKKDLEDEIGALSLEYKKVKSEYESTLDLNDSLELKIEQLEDELDRIKHQLDKTEEEKSMIFSQLKTLESKNKYTEIELSRLKQLLEDKDALIADLSAEYDKRKRELDSALSEKKAADYSYRNAKAEYERISREIESYLSSIDTK